MSIIVDPLADLTACGSCTRPCITACPSGCFSYVNNELIIDATNCIGFQEGGSCYTTCLADDVCPNNIFYVRKLYEIRIEILADNCIDCGCCEYYCPPDAIDYNQNGVPVIDVEKCLVLGGCEECGEVCPTDAIRIIHVYVQL